MQYRVKDPTYIADAGHVHGHAADHVLRRYDLQVQSDGWRCDGCFLDCPTVDRFRCGPCDFDYCGCVHRTRHLRHGVDRNDRNPTLRADRATC